MPDSEEDNAMLTVCLSVCLTDNRLIQKSWTDLDQIFLVNRLCVWGKSIRFPAHHKRQELQGGYRFSRFFCVILLTNKLMLMKT